MKHPRFPDDGPVDETCEGWTNYPTWVVNVWLSNEPILHEIACKLARTSETDLDAADALRRWVFESGEVTRHDGKMVGDLVGYALGEVDWRELGRAWRQVGVEVGR